MQVDAGERSPRTIGEYTRYARPGGEIGWWAGRPIGDIDSSTLEDWSTWLAERGLGAKTRCHVLGAFRTFCTWLRRRKDIISIPEFPERPRIREHEPRIITPEQQDAVLAQIPDDERGIYLVLAHEARLAAQRADLCQQPALRPGPRPVRWLRLHWSGSD